MRGISSERLAIGLLFVVIAVLACFSPLKSDTWWLLRAGQTIWQTHAVPLRDAYSYTAAGLFWPNHEWLTEILFYAAFAVGGRAALTGLCAAAIVAAWATSWRLSRGSFEVRFVVFAASLATAATSWAVRPQAFTLLAFALTVALLTANRLRWLPLVFVLWANLHGAVALGLAAIAGAAAAALVRDRRVPWRLVWTGAACAAATCGIL